MRLTRQAMFQAPPPSPLWTLMDEAVLHANAMHRQCHGLVPTAYKCDKYIVYKFELETQHAIL